MSLTVTAQPENRLTGRRLILARGVWIVLVALALGLYLFKYPPSVCEFPNRVRRRSLSV